MSESKKIGDIAIEREGAAVKIVLEWVDNPPDTLYVNPMHASQLAIFLQQAAAEAKQYEKEELNRYD